MQFRPAENNCPGEIYEIGRGQTGPYDLEESGHGIAGKNEPAKEDTGHLEHHAQLECLHLVLSPGGEQETQVQQGKKIEEIGRDQGQHTSVDGDGK